MLWFGPYLPRGSKPLSVFKNILCYGSAEVVADRLGSLIVFKNILCYGSAFSQALFLLASG